MAVIQESGFDGLAAEPTGSAAEHKALAGLGRLGLLKEAARAVQPVALTFPVSDSPRGLALKSIRLREGFEGFLGKVFRGDNEVFPIAWAWDLSGEPVSLYPGAEVDPEQIMFEVEAGDAHVYMEAGALLFPARPVSGGIVLRIQLWESDQRTRNFGKTLADVAKALEDSKLNNVLSLIALAGGPTTTTAELVKDAALETAQVVGSILKANSNDFVDFYEGYFPATEPWEPSEESYAGHSSDIALTRLT